MLANTRLGDAGKYTCVAVNAAGEHQKDFDLSVYGEFFLDQYLKDIIIIQVTVENNLCMVW